MAKFVSALTAAHRDFIAAQKIYFVASAPHTGRVNLSPKGMDTFRILSPTRVGHLDVTGSGNETAAHLLENGRLTLMMCSFDSAPLIFRIYARGRSVQPADPEWPQLRPLFGPRFPANASSSSPRSKASKPPAASASPSSTTPANAKPSSPTPRKKAPPACPPSANNTTAGASTASPPA